MLIALYAFVLVAQTKGGAQPASKTWVGNFTGQGKKEMLTLDGSDFYLSDGKQPPTLAGSLRDANIGKDGLHVYNLDNNPEDRLGLAYYDPARDTWYKGSFGASGVLDWGPVAIRNGRYTALQVGSGGALYPLDQIDHAAGAVSAQAAQPSPAPLTYPVEGLQYTALAPSQHVWTHFIILADGTVLASTRVKEDALLAGFHARARVAFYTPYDTTIYITYADSPSIGVTGTLWGNSDVTVAWTGHIAPEHLSRIRYYAVLQAWLPNWEATVNDVGKFADAVSKIVQPLTSIIKLFFPGK
jgi:hypothetical protein